MMKLHIIFLLILPNLVFAQYPDNKVNLYAGYSIGVFQGSKMVSKDNFTSPSLYSNYKGLHGYSLKLIAKTKKVYGMGMGIDYSSATDWQLNNYSEYSESKAQLYSLCPIIQLHNKFKETGILNKVKFFTEISPVIGLSKLKLGNPLFDIQSNRFIISQPTTCNNIFGGIKINIGVEMAIHQSIGIYTSYSLQHNWLTSKLYNDQQFTSSQFVIGLFLKIKRDKRYFY